MVLVRASEIALWRADQPDRFRTIVPPTTEPEDEIPPGPPPPPPPGPGPGVGSAPGIGPPPGVGAGRDGERRSREGRLLGGRAPRPNLFAVQVDSRGERLYVLADFNRLHLWELNNGEGDGPIHATRLTAAEPLPDEYTTLALRPDGAILALGDRYGNVTLLDTVRLVVVGRFAAPAQEGPTMYFPMSFSPDGKRLAVGSAQGTILLWNVENPRSPRIALRLPGQRGMVTALAFDPHGCRLASGSVGTEPVVEIWNLELLDRELARLGLPE
jgi:hypothetical protein